MGWLRVSVELGSADVESLEAELGDLGAQAVSVRDAGAEPLLEPDPGVAPLWAQCRVEALFDRAVEQDAIAGALAAAGYPGVRFDTVEDSDWSETWREHAARSHFGDRLWLVPRDEPAPADAAAVLRLDPGLAFGSGTHPTTRLCLSWLATQRLDGRDVLDFGCGSGILGLAALALGCRSLLAVDHDPQALLATRDNAAYNALADARLRVGGPELVGSRRFHVVLANILAAPLVALAGQLTAALRPRATLVLSGLLEGQVEEVVRAYPALTFEVPALETEAGGLCWVRLVGTAPAD